MEKTIRQPQQERSNEKKQKIIEASYELFTEVGYYKANTSDIARRAGVSTGIVYSYFKDKRDILLYVLKIYIEKVTEPISPYAATKSACKQICYTWHHLYGINVVALRFFTVYGPRQRPDLAINKFSRLIAENKPIEMYGDGSTKRDYTFIGDIVQGICASIAYDKTGYEIINLGGGEPITLKRMIQTIEDAMGKKAEIIQKPMQPGDVNKTVCDWSKAQRLLGYQPRTTFEQGIKKFISWKYSK